MKTAILMLFAALCASCQQPSEVDKCVEAMVTSVCSIGGVAPTEKCMKEVRNENGGLIRQKCLRAQAGKE